MYISDLITQGHYKILENIAVSQQLKTLFNV